MTNEEIEFFINSIRFDDVITITNRSNGRNGVAHINREGDPINNDPFGAPHHYIRWRVIIGNKDIEMSDVHLVKLLRLFIPGTTIRYSTRVEIEQRRLDKDLERVAEISSELAKVIKEDKKAMWKILEYRLNNRWIDMPDEETE